MATATAPGLTEIERARERLEGVARVTPVYPSETLSRIVGRPVPSPSHVFIDGLPVGHAQRLQRARSFLGIDAVGPLDHRPARQGEAIPAGLEVVFAHVTFARWRTWGGVYAGRSALTSAV